MTTIQRPGSATTQQRGGQSRGGQSRGGPSRLSGLAFVITYLVGFIVLVTGPNIYEGTLEEYAAGHADEARLSMVGAAAFIVLPLAGAALIWAAAHVSRSLAVAGGTSLAGRVATAGATVMAAATTVAGAAYLAATHVASGTGGFPADPAVGYGLEQVGATAMSLGAWGGSLLLLSVGLGARGTGRLPGWLLWAGIVVAPLLPLAYMFAMIPMLVFLAWVAVVPAIVKTGEVSQADSVVG